MGHCLEPWEERALGASRDTASLLTLKSRAGFLALTKHSATGPGKGGIGPHGHQGGKDPPMGPAWAPPESVGKETSQQVTTRGGGHLEGQGFSPSLGLASLQTRKKREKARRKRQESACSEVVQGYVGFKISSCKLYFMEALLFG